MALHQITLLRRIFLGTRFGPPESAGAGVSRKPPIVSLTVGCALVSAVVDRSRGADPLEKQALHPSGSHYWLNARIHCVK